MSETDLKNNNEYKETKLGWIPKSWTVQPVGFVVEKLIAGVSVNSTDEVADSGEMGVLKTSCVYGGRFQPEQNKLVLASEHNRVKTRLYSNTILISRMNTPELVGENAYVPKDYKHLFLPDRLWMTKFKEKAKLDVKWLSYAFQSHYFKSKTKRLATGTSNSMKNITKSDVLSIKLAYPPLEEQQKIASILSTWDIAIEKTLQLIEKKQQLKKGLMQQLLTGKKRLENYKNTWKTALIGDLLEESRIQTSESDPNRRLKVRLKVKGIEKREFRGTESKDSTTFYVRKAGQFVYGKQNLHKGAAGIIPEELDGYESSQDIPAFDFTDKVNPKWFLLFISRESFYKRLENISTGTGSKRIHPKDLFKVKIPLPSIVEQNAIAEVLTKMENEINLLDEELKNLQSQKKGLMQQLLTGKVRIKF